VDAQTTDPTEEDEGEISIALPELIERLRRMQDEEEDMDMDMDAQVEVDVEEGSNSMPMSEGKNIDAYKVAASVTDWYTEKAGYRGQGRD